MGRRAYCKRVGGETVQSDSGSGGGEADEDMLSWCPVYDRGDFDLEEAAGEEGEGCGVAAVD